MPHVSLQNKMLEFYSKCPDKLLPHVNQVIQHMECPCCVQNSAWSTESNENLRLVQHE